MTDTSGDVFDPPVDLKLFPLAPVISAAACFEGGGLLSRILLVCGANGLTFCPCGICVGLPTTIESAVVAGRIDIRQAGLSSPMNGSRIVLYRTISHSQCRAAAELCRSNLMKIFASSTRHIALTAAPAIMSIASIAP